MKGFMETNNIQIIGISGKAGSGKDWISQNILKPLGFHQWSFAWHFKVWLIGKGEATYEEVFHTKPPHIRKLLQLEGTERGRMVYGENVWGDTMYAWFQVINEFWGINKFVVPDIRFPSEVNVVHNLGGKVFRIVAPNRVANNGLSDEARNHLSETSLDNFDKFDGFIYNDFGEELTVKDQMYTLLGMNEKGFN